MPNFCPSCGKKILFPDAKFCTECGQSLVIQEKLKEEPVKEHVSNLKCYYCGKIISTENGMVMDEHKPFHVECREKHRYYHLKKNALLIGIIIWIVLFMGLFMPLSIVY